MTPRAIATALQLFAVKIMSDDLGPIEDDDNENEWRAPGTQAVNFRFKQGGREFTVTVEDITVAEDEPICDDCGHGESSPCHKDHKFVPEREVK